ncbi:MGH1-like glycoside hydrolase domain-containing protein [Streptomyces sp. NPDC101151]|uniref:MGH1-like glycoside hydrolase domain-containing protein n=1 Tax=Streptomyces sp. NPDC101151 TaxID=3366115 RepID=UPI00382539F0
MSTHLQLRNSAADAALATPTQNRRRGTTAGFSYDFTCPSPATYPFQWAWDSCFHAIALAHIDPPRARAEIESLLHGIDDGFLPHMLLRQEELRPQATAEFRIALWQGWKSVTLAPPVLARAIERVFDICPDEQWLARVVPAACRFYDWLHATRRTACGLLAIYQPDESGLDMSPKYDAALGVRTGLDPQVSRSWHARMRELLDAYSTDRRPTAALGELRRFHWADVLFNTIYADGLIRLGRLVTAREDLAHNNPGRFAQRAQQISAALLRECWNQEGGGVFDDIDLVTKRRERTVTISSLFPLILESTPDSAARRLIDEHLTNPDEFWLPYPVPSVAAGEPSFDATFATEGIFRGSSWINLNWYLYWGLRERGEHGSAAVLAQRTIAAVAASGTRECYGPYDAAGHGARSFGSSTLVLDLIAAEPGAAVPATHTPEPSPLPMPVPAGERT